MERTLKSLITALATSDGFLALEDSMKKLSVPALLLLLLPLGLAGCYSGPHRYHDRDGYRHGRHDHGYYNDYRGRPPGSRY